MDAVDDVDDGRDGRPRRPRRPPTWTVHENILGVVLVVLALAVLAEVLPGGS